MNDRVTGMILVLVAVVGVLVYGFGLIFFTLQVLQLTAFIAVATLLGLIGWIGYTIATTSPPSPPTESEEKMQGKAEDQVPKASS